MSLLELSCQVDDFCRQFVPEWVPLQLTSGAIQRQRSTQLSVSEIMTILIWFDCSHYRPFKAYYTDEVQRHLRAEFPALVSYSRFVDLTPTALVPLHAYLRTYLGACTGLSFLDATALAVCDNQRIAQHHVFRGVAQRARPPRAGSLASNCTCWSTTGASCSISPYPPATPMIGGRFRHW
jgi:hypothetical protein